MSIFPGNVLIIDDQFNLGYQNEEPEHFALKQQWQNFRRLKNLLDNNGFCYSVITETKEIGSIMAQLKKYQNIRLLILDLDLDESGEVEEADILMVKQIVLGSLEIFGYYFLAINSSYSSKWEEIKNEMILELKEDEILNQRKIHFLSNFCISLDKSNIDIESQILDLLSNKFSHELITQFECYLNKARDNALSPFLDFTTETWEHLYKILREDMDSREHVNFTLNSLLFGLLKQQMIDSNYTVPQEKDLTIDEDLHKNIIKGFNYLTNKNNLLDKHPVWTGNLYYDESGSELEKYSLIITPECDIAQTKSNGFTVVLGFELDFPQDYKPENFKGEAPTPLSIRFAGKKGDGNWKPKSEIETFYKGQGFYILLHSSINNKHLVFDLRSAFRSNSIQSEKSILLLRVNEPIITDIMDKYSAIYNRKGVPRLVPKNYLKL